VFLGYWDDPAATAAALDGDRWYRTGDFGRVGGGLLYLESRRRDMIVRGGENVYPVEIENRLVEHPDIDDAAVIGVDISSWARSRRRSWCGGRARACPPGRSATGARPRWRASRSRSRWSSGTRCPTRGPASSSSRNWSARSDHERKLPVLP
jgi:acyl-CoA synthetase (AMP-forming)/AMP-acid ligase II